MSFGLSVSDVFAAAKLASDIWTTCFSSVSGAKASYTRYGEQIKGLGNSLRTLWEILTNHENTLQSRRLAIPTDDLAALAGIIGDFERTLRCSHDLLSKYSGFKRDRRGYITKIKWFASAEGDACQLAQDCAFHISKIQFVIEPLKLKFILDLSGQISDMQDQIVGRLDQLEALIRSSQGLPPQNGDAPPEPAPPYEPPHSPTSPRLEERFEEAFRHHPRLRSIMPEIQIQDYTEAAAWWIGNGTSQGGLQLDPTYRYLNLLKAAWLLKRCELSVDYHRLDKDSLWCNYICGLLKSITDEIDGFADRRLLADNILRLPDDCFFLWLNKPERDAVLGARYERPGEEKILQLNLESRLDPERFTRELLVFRKDDTTLRLCDTTENPEAGSHNTEEFTVNCSNTQFLASYVAGHYNPRGPALNVSMKSGGEHREYLFKIPKDLHDFQRAVVGSQVIFDQPGLSGIICAPSFGSDRRGGDVRIQMWLDKPLPRLLPPFLSPAPSTSASPPPSPQPHMARSMTGRSHSSSGSSSHSSALPDMIELQMPPAPRLVLFYRVDENWVFQLVPMEETLAIRPQRCCGNSLARPFSGNGDACCGRTVLESNRGNIDGLLFASSRDDPAALDVLRATPKHAKRNGEKVGFKYISIDFGGGGEKQRFNKAFESVKTVWRAQKQRLGEQILEAQRQAYAASSPVVPTSGIRRSATWSPMAHHT